jgi:DNA-binding MurR/RpiR family transcriptional regulator
MTSKRLRGEQLEVERFDQLSPKHQRVVQYVAENPSFAAFATASQLGERIGASSATVVRLAQALGFNGYSEFQQNVRHGYLRTLHPMEVLQRPQDGRNLFEAQLYQDILEYGVSKLAKTRSERRLFLSAVDLQAPIDRFVVERNAEPKAFTRTADPDEIVQVVGRERQVLDSIHYRGSIT